MENSLLAFFAGIMLSFMVYLVCKENPKPQYVKDPYEQMYIEKLEQQLEKEQTKNELYKMLLECKN